MRRQQIRKALDEYADAHLPARPDLWPAIQRRARGHTPQAGRIYIEPAGRRMSMLVPVGLVVVLIAVVVVAPLLRPGNGPTLQGTPPPSPSGLAVTAAPRSDAYYADLFTGKLATRLGVDPARLNTAFADAVKATATQAVKDGALTPAEAAQAQAAASQGPGSLLIRRILGAGASGGGDPSLNQLFAQPTP